MKINKIEVCTVVDDLNEKIFFRSESIKECNAFIHGYERGYEQAKEEGAARSICYDCSNKNNATCRARIEIGPVVSKFREECPGFRPTGIYVCSYFEKRRS